MIGQSSDAEGARISFPPEITRQQEELGQKAKQEVINDPELMKAFCKLCVDFTGLNMDQKKKVFLEVLEKVANATFKDKLNTFRARNIARGTIGNEDNLNTLQRQDAIAGMNQRERMKEAGVVKMLCSEFDAKADGEGEPEPT